MGLTLSWATRRGQGEEAGLRELRFTFSLCLPLWMTLGELHFSEPRPPHLSNGVIPAQPCSLGSWLSKVWKGPGELSPDGAVCFCQATCLEPSWSLS